MKKALLLFVASNRKLLKQIAICIVLLFYVLSADAQTDDKYYLTQAKVTLVTGNDNKDNGANTIVKLYLNNGIGPQFSGFWLKGYYDEIKKWQWWTYDLPRSVYFKESDNRLSAYEKYGIALEIWYDSWGGPFPLTDAWKLDKVLIDLSFTTWLGEKHPKYGNLHIEVPNSSLLFTKKKCLMKITTDGNFKPLTPSVSKICDL